MEMYLPEEMHRREPGGARLQEAQMDLVDIAELLVSHHTWQPVHEFDVLRI
jgi:acetyl-CoA carboxylase beta subunit